MPRLTTEQEILSLDASEQLALARRFTGESAFERVQLGRAVLALHNTGNYRVGGFRSVLHLGLGVEPDTLRECLRITFLLRRLPLTCAAVESGQLSWPKLLILLRKIHPDTEKSWLEPAKLLDEAGLEKLERQGRPMYQEEWIDLKRHLPITEFQDELQRAVWESFPPPLSDGDCFQLFGLLHSCKIEYGGLVWEPRTLRGSASLVACIWRGKDLQRADYAYWYNSFQDQPAFAQMVGAELRRLYEIREILMSHPLIGSIKPDLQAYPGYPYDWPRG
jgi:hypothetical protein